MQIVGFLTGRLMFSCVYVFSFPPGVYTGTLNLIALIPGPSILYLLEEQLGASVARIQVPRLFNFFMLNSAEHKI